ncbi:hypothetical protein [Pseudoxanthomonas composti]|uniref:Secreted protein n=1 Tax=Pseudoxanthomonas composti TaxID=2137479 RepID=A0A4Q1JWE1_9GAMM|nr:hypothetical protein [Pseudoxanthomonas composti]RXR06628.1 hypothetical protein EPA99_08315 [Pseudoxanthomonas composti]
MLRASLASVLLLCAIAPALAQTGRSLPSGSCEDLETQATDDARRAGASHPASSAARSKYSAPSATPAAAGSRGGGSDDDALRLRAPKWHSFLPGMFR